MLQRRLTPGLYNGVKVVIDVKADDLFQGYILTVPATSNPLLMPSLRGAEVPVELERRVKA